MQQFGAGGILVARDALRRSSLGGRSVPLVSAGNALEEKGGRGGRSGRVKGRIQKVAEAMGAFPSAKSRVQRRIPAGKKGKVNYARRGVLVGHSSGDAGELSRSAMAGVFFNVA